MTIYKKIKVLREQLGMTQEELAHEVGYKTRSAINKIESGLREINQSQVVSFAKALKTTPAYLMGWEDDNNSNTNPLQHSDLLPIKTKKIPLLGEIACGEPIIANQKYNLYEEVTDDLNADFCVKSKDDSMVGARIQNGDIVFIKEVSEVYNGEIAAVIIEDYVTLKRLNYDKDKDILVLQAENNEYAPQIYTGSDLEKVKILGRAIGFQSTIK